MIIEEVRIHNLFSYCGEQIFDFRGMQAGRNIAIVYGRNGYGKTSFLNALRLLFLGPSDELRWGWLPSGVQRGVPQCGSGHSVSWCRG